MDELDPAGIPTIQINQVIHSDRRAYQGAGLLLKALSDLTFSVHNALEFMDYEFDELTRSPYSTAYLATALINCCSFRESGKESYSDAVSDSMRIWGPIAFGTEGFDAIMSNYVKWSKRTFGQGTSYDISDDPFKSGLMDANDDFSHQLIIQGECNSSGLSERLQLLTKDL